MTTGGFGRAARHDTAVPSKENRLERQLEAAQQITHIGSWEWDARANTVLWSDELYRIYGLEPRSCEVTFESFLARLHPEDRDNTAQRVRAAFENGSGFELTERIVRPDGSIRVLETKGEVVRDDSGIVAGMIGTCRDVTEQRERDEQLELYEDIVQNVQISLTVWSMKDVADPKFARLVTFNPAAEKMARIRLAANVGRGLADIAPATAGTELPELLAAVRRDGCVRELAYYRFVHPSGDVRIHSLKAFPLPGSCVGLAGDDITDQVRARQLEAAEQDILERVASGVPLADILRAIVRHIEEYSPNTIGSVLLLDDDGLTVRHGAAPSLPAEYNLAVDGSTIGPRSGSCGTAMYRKEPVYVSDIGADPLWDDYRHLALPLGLRACWSSPVLAKDGRVLGTFALYYREVRSPTKTDLSLIARATHITGIAIERQQLEDQLRALSAHVESVREDERTGIAREIHDELGQSLTALKMDLAWLGRRAREPGGVDPDVVLERTRALSQMTDEIIGQVRHISAELRPGVLDDLGLAAAVEWQAQAFEQRTGTVCSVSSNLENERLDNPLATAVFRIFQEALTNVARHAEARRVTVVLERSSQELALNVEDDGRGIQPELARSQKSLGLLGMRERARRFGGTMSIAGMPQGGTRLSLRIPLRERGGT